MKERKPKEVNQDTVLNIRISSDITDAYKKLAEEKGYPASRLYRDALLQYLKKQGVIL